MFPPPALRSFAAPRGSLFIQLLSLLLLSTSPSPFPPLLFPKLLRLLRLLLLLLLPLLTCTAMLVPPTANWSTSVGSHLAALGRCCCGGIGCTSSCLCFMMCCAPEIRPRDPKVQRVDSGLFLCEDANPPPYSSRSNSFIVHNVAYQNKPFGIQLIKNPNQFHRLPSLLFQNRFPKREMTRILSDFPSTPHVSITDDNAKNNTLSQGL